MRKIIHIQFRRSRLPRRLLRDGWWLDSPPVRPDLKMARHGLAPAARDSDLSKKLKCDRRIGGHAASGHGACNDIWLTIPTYRSIPQTAAKASVNMAHSILGVELFRLVHAPWLDAFRLTLAGALLLGRIFSPWNLLAYGVGIVLAGLLNGWAIRALARTTRDARTQG